MSLRCKICHRKELQNRTRRYCPGGGTSGGVTTWPAVAELDWNSPPPGKVAVRVRSPGVTSTMEQLPAATSALQVSSPPEAVTWTVPVGVPAGEVTWKVTTTPSAGTDGSGVSAVMAVVVEAGPTSIGPEVTEVNPEAAKISVCVPVAPPTPRFENVARPLGPVVAVAVPTTWPGPVAIAAVMLTPGAWTGLPEASRTWISG